MENPQISDSVALITTSLAELGIRSLKAFLKENGLDAQLYLLNNNRIRYTAPELDIIIKSLEKLTPKIIGISCLEISFIKTRQLIKAIKKSAYLKESVVVAGGIHPTTAPEAYAEFADIIVRGEGEETFLELVRRILDGKPYPDVKNTCFKSNGALIINQLRPLIKDLDKLPFEDYSPKEKLLINGGLITTSERINVSNYMGIPERVIFLFTARGCCWNCSFCMNSALNALYNQNNVRKRSVNKILEFLEKVKVESKAIDCVFLIEDDFFLRNEQDMELFAKIYRERINLPLFLYSNPNSFERRKFRLLLEAGLSRLEIGIQSGSKRINENIYNRNIDNDKVLNTAKVISQYSDKITPTYELIINNPYENKDDLLSTINLIKDIPRPFYLLSHYLIFFRGSQLYKKALADNVINKRYKKYMLSYTGNPNYHMHGNDQLYLNSLIYWMSGWNTRLRSGALIFPGIVNFLLWSKTISLLEKMPRLIYSLNTAVYLVRNIKSLMLRINKSAFERINLNG